MSRELRDADRPILQFAVPLFTHPPAVRSSLKCWRRERWISWEVSRHTLRSVEGEHVIKGGTSNYFLRGMHHFCCINIVDWFLSFACYNNIQSCHYPIDYVPRHATQWTHFICQLRTLTPSCFHWHTEALLALVHQDKLATSAPIL